MQLRRGAKRKKEKDAGFSGCLFRFKGKTDMIDSMGWETGSKSEGVVGSCFFFLFPSLCLRVASCTTAAGESPGFCADDLEREC